MRIHRKKLWNFAYRHPLITVRFHPLCSACIPTMGEKAKEPHPLSMARSAVSAAQNPFTLWEACQLTTARQKMKPVVPAQLSVWSWHHSLSCWRLCSSVPALGPEWSQSCEQQTTRMQSRGWLLTGSCRVVLPGFHAMDRNFSWVFIFNVHSGW